MNIAVCDDDKNYLENELKKLIGEALKTSGANARVCFFSDSEKFFDEFHGGKFDVVILDIDMPNIDGKRLAERLRVIDETFFLVFLTSFKEEIFNTIPFHISAFIDKNFPSDKIVLELKRVISERERFSPEFEYFEAFVNGEKTALKIPRGDIFYINCVLRKIYVHTGKEEFLLCEKRFADIEKRFCGDDFFETCRGYFVNLHKISLANKSEIILDNGERLPLSRGRLKALLEGLSKLVLREAEKRG